MKNSFELKKEIYEKHCEGYGCKILSKKYGIHHEKIIGTFLLIFILFPHNNANPERDRSIKYPPIILNILKATLKPSFLPLSVGLECSDDLKF